MSIDAAQLKTQLRLIRDRGTPAPLTDMSMHPSEYLRPGSEAHNKRGAA